MSATPQPRRTRRGAWSLLPPDLQPVAKMHAELPPGSTRYRTVDGQEFLTALRVVARSYTNQDLAAALDVSSSTIINMLNARRITNPKRWPRDEHLRPLRTAWRVAQAGPRPVRRQDDEFAAVHVALTQLMDDGFEFPEIALAMAVTPRQLRRFIAAPLGTPEDIARAVQTILDGKAPF